MNITKIEANTEVKAGTKYTRRLTMGGGLCAFAGFGQGLVDYALLGRFDQQAATGQFQRFLDIFAALVDNEKDPCKPNWQDFITYLRGHLTPPGTLQTQLAKALRRLMVELRKNGPGVTAGELEHLQSAFQGYLSKKLALIKDDNEDIYSRHAFVRAKFDELAAKHVSTLDELYTAQMNEIEETIEDEAVKQVAHAELKAKAADSLFEICQPELVEWYRKEGYEQFTAGMADDAAYAGDLELKILGRFWGVTFRVERTPPGGQLLVHTICLDFGWLNVGELPAAEMVLLKDLAIVERDADPYRPGFQPLLEMTEPCVLARVAPIEPADEIIATWEAWQKDNAHLKSAERKPVVVPAHWSETAKNELRARNILVKSNGHYYFAPQHEMSKERVLQFLIPFAQEADRQRIIALWKAHYKEAPEIRCANDNAVHWEYCQPHGSPWTSLVSAAPVFPGFFGFSRASVAAALSAGDAVFLKKDAADAITEIENDLCNRTPSEKQFYTDHVIPKLKTIVQQGKVASSGAIRLFGPELVFKITQNGAELTGSDQSHALDILQVFRRMYYYTILSATHEQIISNVPDLRKNFAYIIKSLEGYELREMSELPQKNAKNAVMGFIYVSEDGKYCVRDLHGVVHQGVFSDALRPACKHLAKKLNDVELKRSILIETAANHHTPDREKELKVAKVFRQYLTVLDAMHKVVGQKLPKIEHLKMYDEAYIYCQHLKETGEMVGFDSSDKDLQGHLLRVENYMEYLECVVNGASLGNMATVIIQLLDEELGVELTLDNLMCDFIRRVSETPDSVSMEDRDMLHNIQEMLKDLKKYPDMKRFHEVLTDNPGLKETLMVFLDRVIQTIKCNHTPASVADPRR